MEALGVGGGHEAAEIGFGGEVGEGGVVGANGDFVLGAQDQAFEALIEGDGGVGEGGQGGVGVGGVGGVEVGVGDDE